MFEASLMNVPQDCGKSQCRRLLLSSSDLCMVVGSKMETRLCIVGEMSLRYSSDPQHLNTSLRLNKARKVMAKYTPKSFAGEFPIPSTAEEVAGLKLRVQPVKRKKWVAIMKFVEKSNESSVKTLTEHKAESLGQYKKDFRAHYRCTQVLILTLCKLF